MTNLPKLAEKLNKHGLMQKAFYDMTLEEIHTFIEAVYSSPDDTVPVDGWKEPYLKDGEVVYPFNCHPDLCWWKPGGRSIKDTLVVLEAPFEVADRYLSGMGVKLTEEQWLKELVPF